ncbi:MAG: hydrophobic/amphiphilic exporter-1 (mainly G- bacteria), HAE1 family [bacterium P3]|nr:MAG: hydrophobic/amphiphilic exporter-1 (mainly G- bacteria), HAE1 family [bacterium P3]KWW41942.1 MAG: hydrophobic/amphiphilic exporter-1 (mainly G- bacteria), HAE1 family [bacterium F083]
MAIYKTAIQKPITTSLIFVAVVILGLFSLTRLPIDQMPEMDPPYITVMTTYAGANASEIETNITKIIENSLNSVDGLKNLTSTSRDNISVVVMEFEWGMDLDEALNDIRSYVDLVYDNLPDGVSRPMILKLNTSAMPVMVYGITAEESYSGLDRILEDNVVNVLNRIDGIGNLTVSGAPERYIYIDLDPKQLESFGISLEQVGNAISANNLDLASGTVKMGKEQYQMRVKGEYVESAEIADIAVTTTLQGRQVFVRDLATVRDTIKDLSLDEKINGKDGARLIITKQTGANTVAIARSVRREMEKIQRTLPPDIQITLINDGSEEIINAVNGLAESIFYALLFVVMVVFFFLGDWRSTVIIALTIPISLLTSFIYLLFVDSSLNIISLASLTVAIGMVVDDAIVVLENITKHVDRGENPREAAIYATNEVWTSVIATTLVLVAVFVPLTMLPGMAGVLFKEMGWIITIVVCVSTVAAITLIPTLSSLMLKEKPFFLKDEDRRDYEERQRQRRFSYKKTVEPVLQRIEGAYARLLRWCLGHKRVTMLVALGIFVVSMIPFATGMIGMDFMMVQDNGRISVTAELQRGTRIEETLKTARRMEADVKEILGDDVLVISTSAGSSDDASMAALFNSTTNNKISMTLRCTKKYDRDRTIFEMQEMLRQRFAEYPEIVTYQVNQGSFGGMGSNNLSIEIYGYDFDQTTSFTQALRKRIEDNVPGARDTKVSRDEDRAELKIVFDKQKLALHGLSGSAVALYVRNRVNGMSAGYLKEDGEEYNIVVRLREEYRSSITDIEELTVPTATGRMVKLKELASIEEYWCPPTIERKNRQRYLTLSVEPYNTSLGELAASVQHEIDQMEVPSGVLYALAGSYEDQQETASNMLLLGMLIIMLVYIVMASQFESFSNPFIIMFAIPFALSGVVMALLVAGRNLDMVGMLGIILLIGIVVKNGIVLVDYINLMRERDVPLNDAIAMSGQSRLRPVVMTALTTILGMIPMALSTSEGSEAWTTMGIVVIGGLLVSTLVTLIVVPVLYSVFNRKEEAEKRAKLRKKFVFMNIELDKNS